MYGDSDDGDCYGDRLFYYTELLSSFLSRLLSLFLLPLSPLISVDAAWFGCFLTVGLVDSLG